MERGIAEKAAVILNAKSLTLLWRIRIKDLCRAKWQLSLIFDMLR